MRRGLTSNGAARMIGFMLAVGTLVGLSARPAAATTYTVTSTADSGAGSLRDAIESANSDPGSTIVFALPASSTISLNSNLPMISANMTIDGTISGGNIVLSGQHSHQIFFVAGGTVTIENMTLIDGRAVGGQGGDGEGGGGGGLGAGGALFVNSGANVTVQDVSFDGNTAVGGDGGTGNTANGGGGGGGFGGNGGNGDNGGGGGGGFAGNGGSGFNAGGGGGGLAGNGASSSSNGGGAGGGVLGNGGGSSSPGGGGGGGLSDGNPSVGAAGGDGNSGAAGGIDGSNNLNGNGENGGNGADATTGGGGGGGQGGGAFGEVGYGTPGIGGAGGNGGSGATGGGGGGGGQGGFSMSLSGGAGGNGGNGGVGGGGGGGGQAGFGMFSMPNGGTGGDGGTYGGGGGGGQGTDGSATGGNAGDFGGGGGAGQATGTLSNPGGNGGFGGGGGGAGGSLSGTGGIAGFGGGAGGGVNGGGDGGSGYGGAIFVRDGGTLNFVNTTGNMYVTHSAVSAGTGGIGGTNGSNGSAEGSSFYLHGSTTLSLTSNSHLLLDNSIAGTGGVTIAGTGEVEIPFASVNLYTGDTTINEGRLRLDGSIAGNIIVNADGTLGGYGTAGGNVTNHGTVGPGNSIGRLSISGNYVQDSTGTLDIEINPAGAHDTLDVSGNASLSGTLKVTAAPGPYTDGQQFRFLTTGGTVNGTFTTLDLPSLSGFRFSVLYDSQWVDLLLSAYVPGSYTQYAVTPNQYDIATALDTIDTLGLSDFDPVFTALGNLATDAEYQAAFNQMAGDLYGSVSQTQIQTTTTWLQMMSNQFASQMTGGMQTTSSGAGGSLASAGPAPAFRPSAPSSETYLVSYNQPTASGAAPRPVYRRVQSFQNNAWIQGFGLGSDVSGNGNAGGLNFGSGGLMFGVDRWLNDTTFVGLLGGYANASVRDKLVTSNAQINDYQVGVYAVHGDDDFYFTDIDAYSGGSYTSTRQINFGGLDYTAKGNPNTNSWAHYNEFGHTYMNYYNWMVQPFVGLQYIYYKQNGFTESGGGPLSLTVNSLSVNSLRPSIGMRFFQTYTWRGMRVMPILSAQYQRECADGAQLITSSFVGAPTVTYNTAGTYLGRDFGLFGLGSQVFVNPQMSLYGSLDNQVSAHYSAVVGSGGLIYRW